MEIWFFQWLLTHVPFSLIVKITPQDYYLVTTPKYFSKELDKFAYLVLLTCIIYDAWVIIASTLSSDACNRPEFMLNNGSPVPTALFKSRFQPWINPQSRVEKLADNNI